MPAAQAEGATRNLSNIFALVSIAHDIPVMLNPDVIGARLLRLNSLIENAPSVDITTYPAHRIHMNNYQYALSIKAFLTDLERALQHVLRRPQQSDSIVTTLRARETGEQASAVRTRQAAGRLTDMAPAVCSEADAARSHLITLDPPIPQTKLLQALVEDAELSVSGTVASVRYESDLSVAVAADDAKQQLVFTRARNPDSGLPLTDAQESPLYQGGYINGADTTVQSVFGALKPYTKPRVVGIQHNMLI